MSKAENTAIDPHLPLEPGAPKGHPKNVYNQTYKIMRNGPHETEVVCTRH